MSSTKHIPPDRLAELTQALVDVYDKAPPQLRMDLLEHHTGIFMCLERIKGHAVLGESRQKQYGRRSTDRVE